MNEDHGVRLAIKAISSRRKLAKLLGITPQAIMQWKRIPADRLIEIEAVTGVPREKLRSDLYRGYVRKELNHA